MATTANSRAPRRSASAARSSLLLTGRPALFVLTIGVVVLTLFLPLRQWLAQRAQINALAAQTSSVQTSLQQLKQEQQRWTDPAYVAAQARARLHFVKPGEVGYVILGLPRNPTAGQVTAPAPAAASGAWYERLWSSVQAADSTTKR
ncbi:MAG TPA: septum formation initiator family protein [Solirubrobacterales bacterium]